jgi:alkylated DNA repair dioxygenase AlkB
MRHKAKPDQLPEGFFYQPEFLAESEEIELLRRFAGLPFAPFEFQGYLAKRRIVQYGREYNFRTRRATGAAPLPGFLGNVRDRAARFADLAPEQLVEAVITEYPPGAPIGWHRDVPQFEAVIGISLGSACRMRFKPYRQPGKIVSAMLAPRSIYSLRGAARWEFQHSIPAVPQLRYSVTFRTERVKGAPAA